MPVVFDISFAISAFVILLYFFEFDEFSGCKGIKNN